MTVPALARPRCARRLTLLMPTALLWALAGCGAGAKPAEPAAEAPPLPVEVTSLDRGPVEASWRGTATLTADRVATVVARGAGVVERVLAEEGDTVRAGQALAQLDTERLQLEQARARAQLDKLSADLARAEQVHARGLIAAEPVEQLRFERAAAQAAYDLAALAVREAVIRAPFEGLIARRHLRVGNRITDGTPAFELVALEPLDAELFVPERDLGKLRPGLPVSLSVDAFPDRRFAARILRLSPVVDPATGTVKVTLRVDPGQPELKPGMFARVAITYDRRDDALRLPAAAVITEDAQHHVFVVSEGVARKRRVRLGYQDGGHFEVLEGLAEAEQVVTLGQASLRDNARVTVVGQPADAS